MVPTILSERSAKRIGISWHVLKCVALTGATCAGVQAISSMDGQKVAAELLKFTETKISVRPACV
jgi:hypothetical protein